MKTLKKTLSLLLAVCLAFSAFGCISPAPEESREESREESGGQTPTEGKNMNISSVIVANDFDEAFYEYIAKEATYSFMLSPLSFRYALGLLLAGAEGNTKTELLSALGISSVDEWTEICDLFNSFIVEYSRENTEPGFIGSDEKPDKALTVANSIWKNEDMPFSFMPAYLDYTTAHYSAEHHPFTAANVIPSVNDWVNDKTKGLIQKLLPDDYNADGLAIILMNALYFKGTWAEPFLNIGKDDFTTAAGETVEKTYLRHTDEYYYYADNETELVIVPMYGGVYMTFVKGSTENLAEKTAKAAWSYVQVTVPELDLATSFENDELMNFLAARGVNDAFTGKADFTGMVDDPLYSFYVDDIIQKTRIKLDENGVEAAAVTAIMEKCNAIDDEPPKPIIFTADSTFSFFIYTTVEDTTAMMFAGRISE